MVAALGIALAGCAYVAIDPAYPDERVRWMLEDSGATAVVTDETNRGRTDALGAVPAVVAGARRISPRRTTAPAGDDCDAIRVISPTLPSAADLAYVVYTSGSTGQPKGVMVEHAGLANLVAWHCAAFGLTPTDRCTQIASPGFDARCGSCGRRWPPAPRCTSCPRSCAATRSALRDWMVAEAITVGFLPTAVAETVIGVPWPDGRAAALSADRRRRAEPPPGRRPRLRGHQQLRAQRDRRGGDLRAGRERRGEGPPTIGRRDRRSAGRGRR